MHIGMPFRYLSTWSRPRVVSGKSHIPGGMMRKALPLASLVIILLFVPAACAAADIYITQNTSGGDSGANCANAHSASWFNSNASGGNIYHLCGTFTGTAGQNMLVAPAGSAGNTLTILFEPGAIMT